VPVGIVLVHGGGFGASCWDLLVPYLSTPAIAVDLPGRGRRPADLATVTLDDFATAVAEDIDSTGWDRVVLVGHSLAGITLPRVAALRPTRITHLVFVSCTVPEATGVLLQPCDLGGLRHGADRTWVRLLRDAVLPAAKQDAFVAHIGGARVVDIDAGHMAMISRPAELASTLDRIAEADARTERP
jgi:pimeloyl-ACP methyl ester carboxylesterase